jgi:hypothetical protein
MGRRLILELPDKLYAAVEQAARPDAQSPDRWLLDQLPALLSATMHIADNDTDQSLWTAEEEAQFAAAEAAFEAEWQQHLAEMEELQHRPPPSREAARAEVQAILAKWRGKPMNEEEAIELAMSEEIAEGNLDRDQAMPRILTLPKGTRIFIDSNIRGKLYEREGSASSRCAAPCEAAPRTEDLSRSIP